MHAIDTQIGARRVALAVKKDLVIWLATTENAKVIHRVDFQRFCAVNNPAQMHDLPNVFALGIARPHRAFVNKPVNMF